MKFYHGTSEESWIKIQEEGILFGIPHKDNLENRYTYLTPDIEEAKCHGDVVLEVEYNPVGVDGRGIDNYGFDPPFGKYCWQFCIFVPISISYIRRLIGPLSVFVK